METNLPGLSAALINDDFVNKPVRLLCEAGFYTAALSLMNSMLGAGILAYPYAYMSSGTLVGTILALTIGGLSFMARDRRRGPWLRRSRRRRLWTQLPHRRRRAARRVRLWRLRRMCAAFSSDPPHTPPPSPRRSSS